jgi:Skp family chaperone for outer membrane proteins
MKPKRSASVSALSCRSLPILLLTALLLWCPTAGAAEGRTRIGVISVDTVLEHLKSWQDTQTQLKARTKEAQARLAKLKKESDRLRAELDYFKPDSRDHQVRQAQLAAKQQEHARLGRQLRQTIANQAREAHESARRQIAAAVKTYAIANGFDVVVDARVVFYVAGGADISLKVALAMNKSYKGMAPKKSPKEVEER